MFILLRCASTCWFKLVNNTLWLFKGCNSSLFTDRCGEHFIQLYFCLLHSTDKDTVINISPIQCSLSLNYIWRLKKLVYNLGNFCHFFFLFKKRLVEWRQASILYINFLRKYFSAFCSGVFILWGQRIKFIIILI